MQRARYQRYDRNPPGFTRGTKLRELAAGDQVLWSDDGLVSEIVRIGLAGEPNGRQREYEIETRRLDRPDAPTEIHRLKGGTKLLTKKITASGTP